MCLSCLEDYKKAIEFQNIDFHRVIVKGIENFTEEDLKEFSTEDLEIKDKLLKRAKRELRENSVLENLLDDSKENKNKPLFVFRFESKSVSCVSGYYYFIAENQIEAIKLASRFQHENNEKENYLHVYSIFFDFKDIKCFPIEKGILKVLNDFR